MFLSSWLESFQSAVGCSTKKTRGRRSRLQRPGTRSNGIERLEWRALLTPPIITPTFRVSGAGTGSSPPYIISHSSTFNGEINGLDGSEIAIRLTDIDLPPDSPITLISAVSNDTTILHRIESPTNANLTFRNETGTPSLGGQLAYIQFSPGTALFGSTTITVTAVDSNNEFTTLDIPVQLNDVPSLDPLTNISAFEDSPPITVPLSGITAGFSADQPSNGGQARLVYATSTNTQLTGKTVIQYDAAAMDQIGALTFYPVAGAPVAVNNPGDNIARITVTVEDAGVDNILGFTYDPVTGKVTTTNSVARLDNIRRTRTFTFTIIPENDAPTVNTISDVTITEDNPPTNVTLTGITPGGGSSVIGLELQHVSINPATTTDGYFTLTFDNGTHSYTTDPIPHNAQAVTSVDETLRLTTAASGGTFTLTFADDLGAVTSLYDAIDDNDVVFAVDDSAGFPQTPSPTNPFVISIDSEEMLVFGLTASPVPGNPNRVALSVQRGYHGTTAAAHLDDASVLEVKTTKLNGALAALPGSQLSAAISNVQTTFNVANGSVFPVIFSESLANPIDDTVTTITLNSFTPFPGQTAPFKIQIGGELMTVTQVTGNQFDVLRGQDGTTATIHLANDTVFNPFTVRVDREEMRVINVTGNTLTVVRGVNGTAVAAHAARPVLQVDGVLTVVDAGMVGATAPFEIRVDDEDILVTGVFGNQLLTLRGIHGTTIAPHLDAAVISSLQTTVPIAFDADSTEIETALLGLPAVNGGDVIVTGGPLNTSAAVIQFTGALSTFNLQNLVFDDGQLFGDELQSLSYSSNSFTGSGTFTLTVRLPGQPTLTTAPIPFDASDLQIQAALEALASINPGDVIVTPSGGRLTTGALTIQFTGQYSRQNIQPVQVNIPVTLGVESLVNNERQQISFFGNPTGGTFNFTFPLGASNYASAAIQYNGNDLQTSSDIEAALEGTFSRISGPGAGTAAFFTDVIVTNTGFQTWEVEFAGNRADTNVFTLGSLNSLTGGTGPQIFIVPLEEGDNDVFFDNFANINGFTPAINLLELTPGALSVQDALLALPSMSPADILASGSALPTSTVDILFTGTFAGLDVAPLTANSNPFPNGGLTDGIIAGTAVVVTDPFRVFDGENQKLKVLAISSNPDIVPHPVVTYVSPQSAATLSVTNNKDQFGEATITVTIVDSGFDQNLDTIADNGITVKTFKVTVLPTNDQPTIKGLPDLSVEKNRGAIVLPLAGISAGGGESQDLRVEAFSNNLALVPNPSVNYTPGSTTGMLTVQPFFGAVGTAIITVKVTDAGLDGSLNGIADNSETIVTFRLDVSELPVLGATPSEIQIPESSALQNLLLTGITAGGAESQPLQLAVTHTNTTLFSGAGSPTVTYTSANNTATLNFQPTDRLFGSDVFRLTLTDGGPDGSLGSADNLTAAATATTTTLSVVNSGSYPAIPTSSLLISINSTATTITLLDASSFPDPALPLVNPIGPYDIQVGNETMTVTGKSGNSLTVVRAQDGTAAAAYQVTPLIPVPVVKPFKIKIDGEILRVTSISLGANVMTVVRGVNGTTAAAHALNAAILHPQAFDNLSIVRDINVVVTPVNNLPTLDDFIPAMVTIPESSGLQLISFSGVTDGEAPGPAQPLVVTAVSNNTGLTGVPTVNYSGGTIGTLRFTPVTGQSGITTIDVTVTDGGLDGNLNTTGDNATRTKTLTINIVPIGDLPTLTAIGSRSVLEDAAEQTVNLTGITDGDNNTQQLRVTAVSSVPSIVAVNSLSFNPGNLAPPNVPSTGVLKFQPVPDAFGSATITVTVTDGGVDQKLGDSDLVAVNALAGANSITVADVTKFPNLVPFANYEIVIDGETLIVTGITGSNLNLASPTTANHLAGAVVGQPNTALDNVSITRTFNVTVGAVNDNPRITAPPTTITIPESAGPQTIPLTGIDSGPSESQNLSITVTSNNTTLIPNPTISNFVAPTTGVPGSATVNYQPVPLKFGTATLTVKIMDAGLDGNLGTLLDNGVTLKSIVVVVNPINDPPTLNAVSTVTASEDSGQKTVSLTGITAGGGEFQILKVTPTVVGGSESIAGLITNLSVDYSSPSSTGVLKFTPGANLFGTATIRVTVEDAGFDGVLNDNPSTVVNEAADNATFFRNIPVSVGNVNDAPSFTVPVSAQVNKNNFQNLPVNLTGVYDGDLNSQTLTFSFTSSNPSLVPAPANIVIPPAGSPSVTSQTVSVHFNPAADQSGGPVTITVTANDGVSAPVIKSFPLTVLNTNLPPTIDPIADVTGLSEPIFPATPTPQLVSLTGITDGDGAELPAQTLTVTAMSSDPTAFDDLSVTYSSDDPTGTLSFTPSQDAAGTFTITVRVSDGNSFTDTLFDVVIGDGDNDTPALDPIANKVIAKSASPTLATVNLTGISDGPFESGPVTVTVLSNDNETLVPLLTGSAANYTSGTTGTLTFTPAANSSGVANLIIRVQDLGGTGLTFDRAFSVFVVNPPTLDPVGSNQIPNPAAIPEDTLGTQFFMLTGISDGDLGTEGVELSAVILSDPSGVLQNLSTTLASPTANSGSVNYELVANKSGTATIQVTVKDQGPNLGGFNSGDESTITKTFVVTVTPVNDDPTLNDQAAPLNLLEDALNGILNLTGISAGPLETQTLQVTAVSNDLSKVTVQSVSYVNGQTTGSVTVKPVANAFGTATITVTVTDTAAIDGIARSVSKDFVVNIAADNDAPTLNLPANVTVNEDSGTGMITLTGITAGGGESQTLSISATSDNPDLMFDPVVTYSSPDNTATLHFTPLDNAAADAFITVTVTDDASIDGVAKSTSKTFKITVNPVNDAPEFDPVTDTVTIDEGLANGTEVLDAGIIDPEGQFSSLAISLLPAGNVGGAFSIDNAGIIRVANVAALNFESNPVFNLTVRVVDNTPIAPTGQVVTHNFTVNLNDLAETLTIGAGNWPTSGGLTIKRDGANLRVLNSSNVDVVPAHAFANVTNIQVTGRSGSADVLTLDYSGGDPIPTGMPEGLTFNGATGLGDTLRFANASFGQLDTTFFSATSAVIDDPAAPISLTGIESIAFNTSVTATNLNFIYPTANHTITFADDGSTNGLTGFSSLSSPAVLFAATGAGVTVNTGDGNNTVTFNSVENGAGPAITVQGGSGTDRLTASAVSRAVALFGGDGNDTLIGGSGGDNLDGEGDDDLLTGGLGNDTLEGGSGDNTLYESANVNVTLGASSMTGLGSDDVSNIQFAVLVGGAGANAFDASSFGGQVTLTGAGGNDTLIGSGNDDQLTGGDGNDHIDGGGGSDTLIESGNVNFTLGASTLTGLGSDTISGIELARLTGGASNNTIDATHFAGDVTLLGGAGNDILKGGSGNDSISGEAGNDTLTGAGGTNGLNGGDGTDQLAETGDVDFTLLAAELTSLLGTDTLISIETAKLTGGSGDNTLDASGFSGKVTLQGSNGADTLIGGSNADSLEGGNGDDVLTGGLGNDTLNGGANNDTIVEDGLTSLSMTPTGMTGRGTDVLTSMELGRFTGTATNNTLSGGTFAGALTIDGLEGNDNITGGNGADTIEGGDGNDTVNGGAGNDFIRGGLGKDRLSGGAGNDQIDGGEENDTLSGQAGNDTILGGGGNDSILGGDDNDAIDGQEGDDIISGEKGNDTLIGGVGKDSILGGDGNDFLYDGDFLAGGDSDKDTLRGGNGTDTVIGAAGFDVLDDLAAQINSAFSFNTTGYHTLFDALLGP